MNSSLALEGRPNSGWLNQRTMWFGSTPTSPSMSNVNNAGIPDAHEMDEYTRKKFEFEYLESGERQRLRLSL